jgi:hypothetical protein
MIEEINEARELGERRKYRPQLNAAELLVIDDLFLRKLPVNAGEELADVLMSHYGDHLLRIDSVSHALTKSVAASLARVHSLARPRTGLQYDPVERQT